MPVMPSSTTVCSPADAGALRARRMLVRLLVALASLAAASEYTLPSTCVCECDAYNGAQCAQYNEGTDECEIYQWTQDACDHACPNGNTGSCGGVVCGASGHSTYYKYAPPPSHNRLGKERASPRS